MATLISELREPLRALLGDHWFPYMFEETALDAGVRAAISVGKAPGYIFGDEGRTTIEPELAPLDLARLLYQTALLFVAGERRRSYRTRELSESFGDRQHYVEHLRQELHLLESGGGVGVFATRDTFLVWLKQTTGS